MHVLSSVGNIFDLAVAELSVGTGVVDKPAHALCPRQGDHQWDGRAERGAQFEGSLKRVFIAISGHIGPGQGRRRLLGMTLLQHLMHPAVRHRSVDEPANRFQRQVLVLEGLNTLRGVIIDDADP